MNIREGLAATGLAMIAASPLAAQSIESSVTQPSTNSVQVIRLDFDKRPSISIGNILRVGLRLKLQSDARSLDGAPGRRSGEDERALAFARRRIGIEGVLFERLEFQVERELREDSPWRDAFLNFRAIDLFQARGGQFKIPFGLDQLTSATRLDFVNRSRIGDELSPGRDPGFVIHGRAKGLGLTYEAGVFAHDGDNARFDDSPGAGATLAVRTTVRPFARAKKSPPFAGLELAVAMTSGDVPEGLHSLRGRTTSGNTFFDPVYVSGRRQRIGADADWSLGRLSLKAEVVRVSDERRGQGLLGEDLPPVIAQGWYLGGTWTLFRPVEIAARYERIAFHSSGDGSASPPSLSPRAANILEASDRVSTAGVNWRVNRWTRLQGNVIREQLGSAGRASVLGHNIVWVGVCRLQFVI